MIIQTGMRTDIPAFYSEWFINRIKEKFVYTRNPYYKNQVTKYILSPDIVDIINFCTKNPAPMIPYLELLEPYGQYWFVTITPYDNDIEPNVPPKDFIIKNFKRLSKKIGIDSIGWRYDPIFITKKYNLNFHIETFEKIAKALCGYTNTCVISFIDLYEKTKRNFPEVKAVSKEERIYLGKTLIKIAQKYNIVIRPCAEGDELEKYGTDCSGCMTVKTYETAIHSNLKIPNFKSQRAECACLLGKDIGEYNSCLHLCKYCYANAEKNLVLSNFKNHNPNSPFLIGESSADDIIHIAKQESWKDNQMKIFRLD